MLFALMALLGACAPAFPQEVHFAPEENLETIDAALIGTARRAIDLASFIITDKAIIDALGAAERRGVALRIVLDPHEPHAFGLRIDLADHIRIRQSDELMHLKGYVLDGETLRTGSANFAHGGEIYQDNDLIIIRDRPAGRREVRSAFRADVERVRSDRGLRAGGEGDGAPLTPAGPFGEAAFISIRINHPARTI